MKQILQNLKDGSTEIAEVPCPRAGRGQLLIRTTYSLVSAGTERMLVEFGKASLIEKARQQPDKVGMVLDKIRTDGLLPTLEAVRNKLDLPLPVGYCNVGKVVEVGTGVTGFKVGDHVASNGRHAEIVNVPVNLCSKVPNGLSDEEAAFTVLASIALQGIRLAQPTLGEAVVVTGLGLIGLLAVQLLRAHGCRVLGLDFDSSRLELARRFGAEVVDLGAGADPLAVADAFSHGHGIDAVVITASTRSSEPVRQAAMMCRKRGRIILVGVTGLELSRADFYEKEISFQVSCSYGPGRYDPNYEDKGQDYPIGFVRWTEQRNFEAVLDMLAERRLDVIPLISHRYAITDAVRAYTVVGGSEPSLGILLAYPADVSEERTNQRAHTVVLPAAAMARSVDEVPSVSVIGAGNYAGGVLIPAFKEAGVHLRQIASSGGANSIHLGRKFGFSQVTTDTSALLADITAGIIVVATRHDSHADYVLRALAAGKHVFVEKPLALTQEDLMRIQGAAAAAPNQLLMVGFNRRFAPHVQRIKLLLASAPGPKAMVITVNAGAIPTKHWVQDLEIGGGRLLGECCHFVDLLRFLIGANITSQQTMAMDSATGDSATVTLRFADGSIGTVHYLANGTKAFPKERLEIFVAGRILQLDNFRRLAGFDWPSFAKMNLWRQDKGQKACVQAFVDAVKRGGPSPIPFEELLEVSSVSIAIAEAMRN